MKIPLSPELLRVVQRPPRDDSIVLSVRVYDVYHDQSSVYEAQFDTSVEENYILRSVVDELNLEIHALPKERHDACYSDFLRKINLKSLSDQASKYLKSVTLKEPGKSPSSGLTEDVQPEWRAVADPRVFQSAYSGARFVVVDSVPWIGRDVEWLDERNFCGKNELLLGYAFIKNSMESLKTLQGWV